VPVGGGVITGDEIAGLARAFFYAGTPSIIVSVWDVAGQPTNRLLERFRERCSAGRYGQLETAERFRLVRSVRLQADLDQSG
jgi:CHAT domain-containing protein